MFKFIISLILAFTYVNAIPINPNNAPSLEHGDESFEQGGQEGSPRETSTQITSLEWIGIIIGSIVVVALTVGGVMACRWRLHRNSSNMEMRQRALANYRQAARRDAAAQQAGRGTIPGDIRMPTPTYPWGTRRNDYEMH